jgi:hypothetical protein
MKCLFLASISLILHSFLAQNNYSYMPNTINIKIVKPIPPVKPVDYGRQFSNLSNSFNDVATSREAKRQELESITNEGIKDIQMYITSGYSISVNKILSAAQASANSNVKLYYSKLTNGEIDPDDYPSIISKEVNNYIAFASSINSINELLKNKIDELNKNNLYDRIASISNALDNYLNSTSVVCQYNSISKNKKYNLINDQRIELERYSIISLQEFLNSISSIVNVYGSQSDNNQFYSEIFNDLQLTNEFRVSLQKSFYISNESPKYYSVLIPLSFKKINFNQFERKYTDKTNINVSLHYISIKSNLNTKLSSREYIDSVKHVQSLNSQRPTLGFKMNETSNEISEVFDNSSAKIGGLIVGDKILEIEKLPFDPFTSFNYDQYGKGVGDTIQLKILRGQNIITKNLILKKNENFLFHFNINLGINNGVLIVGKEEIEDYGEVKKFLNVTCMNAIDENMIVLDYKIQLSDSLAKKNYKEAFDELKPLIKGINDSLKIIE